MLKIWRVNSVRSLCRWYMRNILVLCDRDFDVTSVMKIKTNEKLRKLIFGTLVRLILNLSLLTFGLCDFLFPLIKSFRLVCKLLSYLLFEIYRNLNTNFVSCLGTLNTLHCISSFAVHFSPIVHIFSLVLFWIKIKFRLKGFTTVIFSSQPFGVRVAHR